MRILRSRSCLFAAVLLFAGCGNRNASPEGLSKAVLDAANKRDKDALRLLWPNEEVLQASFDCDADSLGKLRRSIEEERERMAKKVTREDEKDAKLEWVGLEDNEEKLVATGESSNGCKARVPIVLKKVHIKAKLHVEGKSEDKSLRMSMARFGERGWFLVDQ